MKLIDRTKGTELASRMRKANNYFERMKGLLGTKHLDSGEGLWIPRCQGIHTFGMRFAIDVIFLDSAQKIVQLNEKLEPNRIGPVTFQADSVVELPAGSIESLGVHIGDQVEIQE